MAVSKPRNRILIFRLTEEEYATLQAASAGARSLSEFARGKLMGAIQPDPLADLHTKIDRIEQLLERN